MRYSFYILYFQTIVDKGRLSGDRGHIFDKQHNDNGYKVQNRSNLKYGVTGKLQQ